MKLLAKNASEVQNFSQEDFYSQNSRDIVAKVSVWILCYHYFALTHFHGKSLFRSFWWKTWKMQFEQKLKTRKHKNTFKNI